MSDEVWWVCRDNRSQGPSCDSEDGFVCVVSIYRHKPEFVRIEGEWFSIGGGLLDTMHVEKFRLYSGVNIKPGEIIAIRPLRIEIEEVHNADK